MGAANIFAAYFGSLPPMLALSVMYGGIAGLWALHRAAENRPRWRLGLLTSALLLSVLSWGFVLASLFFCSLWAARYFSYPYSAIRDVFNYSLLASLSGIPVLFVVLKLWLPRLILNRLRAVSADSPRVSRVFFALTKSLGFEIGLLETRIPAALSLTVNAGKPLVVVSQTIQNLLDDEELEAVLAHELAHIRNHDITIKSWAAACRSLLPFDLIIRLVDAAIHRESELAADAIAAEATKKPMALASALIKIHEQPQPRVPPYVSSMLIGAHDGRGVFARVPPLRKRVDRLLKMAELMGLNPI